MNLRELLLEKIERTGKGHIAVIGWGRGMGHKGHMMLASSVITHAKELEADPYFVVSRTFGPDDPLKPEEKLAIYKKVFPEQGHIFQTASDELPDLTRVLTNLNQQGYRNAVVVVGADQVKAFQYLNAYNGKPNKAGEIPFQFDDLQVISRQMTNDPSREKEGPRATPMRQVLQDPSKSDEEQFAVWRDAMSDNIPDDEVRNLMNKAKERMMTMKLEPKRAPAKKHKEQGVAEGNEQKYSVTIDAIDHGVLGAITVSASNPAEAKQKVVTGVKKSMAKRGYELMVRSVSVKPVQGVSEGFSDVVKGVKRRIKINEYADSNISNLKNEVSDAMIKRYFSGAMKYTISGKKDRNPE